jgi:hypothetical protein
MTLQTKLAAIVTISSFTTGGIVYGYAKKVANEEANKLGYTWDPETKDYIKKFEGPLVEVAAKKAACVGQNWAFQETVNNRVNDFARKVSTTMNVATAILILVSIVRYHRNK